MLSHAAAQEQEWRTWTNATGKFKVKAKFIDLSNGKVTLEREDGAQITIPLDKLCKADQETAQELQSHGSNPFEVIKPPLRSPRRTKATEEPRAEPSSLSSGDMKIVDPDWSNAKPIALLAGERKWDLAIDAPQQPSPATRRAIAIPPKRDFFDQAKTLVINPVCRKALLTYALERPGSNAERQLRLFLFDLERGKLLSTFNVAAKVVPVAMNDAGTDIAVRTDGHGFGNQGQLEIWRLTDSRLNKLLQWKPYGDQNGPDQDVKWVEFLPDDRLATLNSSGKLTLWNAATAEPLAWLQVAGNCHPALSPDRRYLAFATDQEIGLLDLQTTEVVAMKEAPKAIFPGRVLAFTPRGTRLACSAGDRVYIFDAATGALYRELSLAGANIHAGDNLCCPNEENVFVGNRLLIDIESQVKLWTYDGHGLAHMLDGVCWFCVADRNSSALIPTPLPHPGAIEKIQKALEASDLFVLKPGVAVKLNVGGIQDPAEREKAATALTQKLQANGCRVDPNGAVELVAMTEQGRHREIAYRTFGRPFAREFTFQEYHSRIKILHNGQTAWEVSCSNVPGVVNLSEGETIQEFLQRNEHPNYEWFGRAELPKLVQKPTAGGLSLGASRVTVSGVR